MDARGARWGCYGAGPWARGRSSECGATGALVRGVFGAVHAAASTLRGGQRGRAGGIPPKRYARMVCRKLLRLRTGESRRSLVVAAMYVRYISQVKSSDLEYR